jgi:hypothetical protein
MYKKDAVKTTADDRGCGCGPAAKEHIAYTPVPVTGTIASPAGAIDVVSPQWCLKDYLGAIGVRLGIRRMEYAVRPGLYAIGTPGRDAPVLVSANYKLSFDILRRELAGLHVWVLVIDTKGINVWCAAGKGTFGTMEIARRVAAAGLANIVSHRKLVVPQLGAPGVAAHMVQAFCDFSVQYGPVRASDIKQYLAAGMKAGPAMRRVTFGVLDRLDVAWFELTEAARKAVIISGVLFVVMGITLQGFSLPAAWNRSSSLLGLIAAGILSGTLLTAAFLPLLPGKAFSFKGGVAGAVLAGGILLFRAASGAAVSVSATVSILLFVSAVSAYLALNYTGCSTYTSLSGVKKEIRCALPAIIGMVLLSGAIQIIGRIV